MGVTSRQYNSFQKAYAFFNRKLFGGELPEVLITLQRQAHMYGYFSQAKFEHREREEAIDEIALNPDLFAGHTDEDILSTLAHEMVHVWQAYEGHPSRNGYHNHEWAEKAKSIGLLPFNVKGGGEVGQQIDHVVEQGGAYQKAFQRLVSQRDFKLEWNSIPYEKAASSKKKASKTKFTCPVCGQHAWAKATASLVCGAHHTNSWNTHHADIIVMLAEPSEDSSEEAGE